MGHLGRLLTAMVTPFDGEGRVDFARAKELAMALLASGSDGLIVSGTTGESPTLTRDEKLRLFQEIKSVAGDATVVAGTGDNETAFSIEMTREADRIGVDAALLVVPYYNKPTQEGLYQHFKAIAESVSIPCILYNVPSRTVTNLSAATTLRLSAVPNIAGIKEASGDLDQIGEIIDGAPEDFFVWSGNDSDFLPVLVRGGYGVVSVASHLVGKQMREMMELQIGGDPVRAEAIHNRLMPVFRDLFVISNPIPVKYALNQVGFPVGGFRLPLTQPDEESARTVMESVRGVPIDLPLPAAAS